MSRLHAAVQAHQLRALFCLAFWLTLLLGGGTWLGQRYLPGWMPTTSGGFLAWSLGAWLLAINACTWQFWSLDKRLAAQGGRVRVPEALLLWLACGGGVPAALLGMRLLRHKSSKRSFQWRLLPIGLLWLGVVAFALWTVLAR